MPSAKAQDTIKVGILHSLSGTMAISETTLKDVMLMLIDEQNKKGGVLGKKLEAVVVDPASNWPLFAEKARELITKDKVVGRVRLLDLGVAQVRAAGVQGAELDPVLSGAVRGRGERAQRVLHRRRAEPAGDPGRRLSDAKDEKVKRWVLAGTDYVYPRTTNKILEAYLKSKGVKQEDIMINYTPFGHSDWQTIVADIKKFGSAGKKTAVVSTINGDANVPFYKELGNQGVKANGHPGRGVLGRRGRTRRHRHQAAARPSRRLELLPVDQERRRTTTFIKRSGRPSPRTRSASPTIRWKRTSSASQMWVKAVEKVKSTDPDKVIDALPGIEAPNLTGGTSKMLPNHHITKPVFIGEVRADGQFDVVWKTPGLVPGDAWSKELDGSKDLIGDWVEQKCGNYNIKTNKCGGA